MYNLLSAGVAILDRLRDQVPDFRTVEPAAFLSAQDDIAPLCPAAFVVPGHGEEVKRGDESILTVERQYWQVTVCVAYLHDDTDPGAADAAAGKLLALVRKALWAWAPSADHSVLQWVDRPAPFYETGYAEFPVRFRADLKLKSLLN